MQQAPSRPRVYLAGPEVFLPDALAAGAAKQGLCDAHGFEGVFPLDASLDLSGLTKHEAARRIAMANEALMRSADALIANLTPFRGASLDAGTAFEVGFMRALGRPVLGYSNASADYHARARAVRGLGFSSHDCDRPDVAIEDFDLTENLMIEIAIVESGGTVVRNEVPGPGRMAALAGFGRCLVELQRVFDEVA